MLEYKVRQQIENENGVLVRYAVYKGAVTTEDEMQLQADGSIAPVPVTRFRRIAMVGTKEVLLPVGTAKGLVTKRLEKELKDEAAVRKDVVVEHQREKIEVDEKQK